MDWGQEKLEKCRGKYVGIGPISISSRDTDFCIQDTVLGLNEVLWKICEKKKDYQLSHICLSVRPSVRMEKLGSHRNDFHENRKQYFSKMCPGNSNVNLNTMIIIIIIIGTLVRVHVKLLYHLADIFFRKKRGITQRL